MDFSARETIRQRKSVRTFDGRPLGHDDREALERFLRDVPNPFGIPVEFRLLDTGEHGVSSPVVIGTDTYVAAKARRCEGYEIGYGYSFECLCLFAGSLGLGTVMLAASLSRKAFERAMGLRETEVMPVASPVGYPAARPSVRERLMRKGLKADERHGFEELFFDGTYGKGLRREDAGVFAEALEMARWAPSATNRQPWRAVVSGDTVHFFEEKTLKDAAFGDTQKVDVGIALAHFDLTMREAGSEGCFREDDPHASLPEGVHYITSYVRQG